MGVRFRDSVHAGHHQNRRNKARSSRATRGSQRERYLAPSARICRRMRRASRRPVCVRARNSRDASARRINARNEFFAMTAQEAQILLSLLVAAPSNNTEQFTTMTFAHHVPERLEIEDVDARPTRTRASGPSGAAYEPDLRDWIESNYTRIPLREKDTGTKLETLFGAYASANPPVHLRLLGRNKFAAMLNSIFPNIGPYRNTTNTVSSCTFCVDAQRP